MIGIVSRVTAAGVFVRCESDFPGQELGPLLAATYRADASVVALVDAYEENDRVLVVEDTPNEFIVQCLLKGDLT